MDQNQIEQGIRLRKLIKALGLNQTLFAKSLGMTQPNISRMVSGEGKISVEALNRITGTHKRVNLHWLLTGEGEMFVAAATETSIQANEASRAYMAKGKGRLEDLEERVERLEEAVSRLIDSKGK
ncbi:MAG: helix-turn-helix domain-containing protein [Saprospirales bacterium]|jgi:transcriptional regulator with XRE-family HTH domain|nr:helix-turn-helix domain-containing protein [Saprospirales bacterium]MBK8920912.1 helix-turn-helix domain-containing protein [Saprospirales bacterium]